MRKHAYLIVPALAVALSGFLTLTASAQVNGSTYYDSSTGITYTYDANVGYYYDPATGLYNTSISSPGTPPATTPATTPGLPSTGMGGEAAVLWSLLGASAVAAGAGSLLLKRKIA